MYQDLWSRTPMAIAVNEASALLIEPDGRAFFHGQSSSSAVYLMTIANPESIVCRPKTSLTITADVIKMNVNGTYFYDFSTNSPIFNPDSTHYQLTASKNKVTSSSGSVY